MDLDAAADARSTISLRRVSTSGGLAIASLAVAVALAAQGCTPVTGTAVPIDGLVNQADLQLSSLGVVATGTSFVESGSYLDFRFTPTTNLLELTKVELAGSDVRFELGSLGSLDARNVAVHQAASAGFVEWTSGLVHVIASVIVESDVYLNGAFVAHTEGQVLAPLSGIFAYDAAGGTATLTDFGGTIPQWNFVYGPLFVQVDGELTLNFEADVSAPPSS